MDLSLLGIFWFLMTFWFLELSVPWLFGFGDLWYLVILVAMDFLLLGTFGCHGPYVASDICLLCPLFLGGLLASLHPCCYGSFSLDTLVAMDFLLLGPFGFHEPLASSDFCPFSSFVSDDLLFLLTFGYHGPLVFWNFGC